MKKNIWMILLVLLPSWVWAASAQEEANKKTVLAFYEVGLNQKDAQAASKFFGEHYIQHNPQAEDGIEGFQKFIAFLKDRFPKGKSQIKRVFAEGDFVILHVHSVSEPGQLGSAIVDIFRLEKGKIVEHWDVIQAVPEKQAHPNGMF